MKRKSGNENLSQVGKCRKVDKKRYYQQAISFTKIQTTKVENFSLHRQVFGLLSSYLKDYQKRSKEGRNERGILLKGNSGCGKSYLVREVASQLKLELIEISFGSSLSKSEVLRAIEEASKMLTLERNGKSGTLIFIDDIDVIYEYDFNLYLGIENIVKISKAPVLMTCTEHLKGFLEDFKTYSLTPSFDGSLYLVSQFCLDRQIHAGDEVIKNILTGFNLNLTKIFSTLSLNTFDWFYGPEFKILSEKSIQLQEVHENLKEIQENFDLIIENNTLLPDFLDNAAQLDLLQRFSPNSEGSYRLTPYFSSMESVYKKHCEKEPFLIHRNQKPRHFKSLVRESFLHLSDPTDHINFLQTLQSFSCALSPLATSFQIKSNHSYLDLFLI